jgi:heptosyltransferase-2/heptosyltransferase-3
LIAHIPLRQQQESQPRILLIRPDHLGDVLLSTPAIRALKAARPATELHALVGPWSANVLANIPEVDAVLTLNFPGFERDGHKRGPFAPYIQLLRSARHLRQIGYTSAVILRPDHWWGAVLAYLAGIPQRIGYHLPEVAPFLTHGLELRREHVVMQNCRLVEQWTGPMQPEDARYEFPVYDADSDYINDYLQNWGITPSQDLICIHPGSGTWVKLWQAEKWASVADTLSEQLDAQVVFTGGEQERALVQQIAAGMRHNPCIMVGDTRLEQLAALYSRAKVVLGPDSGPMHLAAAVGTPTVTLYGPADPVEFGTWGPKAKHFIITTDIGCRPCRVLDWADDNPEFHPCVREITIGQVLSAARQAANYRS